jgi:membrane dipeptidase
VHCTADIERAKREGKTRIILGWQNLSGIEDRLEYLGLSKRLGVGVMSPTKPRTWLAAATTNSHDGDLSDFGCEVIHEMNRLRILCDLSHVGPKPSEDVGTSRPKASISS